MDRIVITGDLTRPNSQEANIKFIYELIRTQLHWLLPEVEVALHNRVQTKNLLEWVQEEYVQSKDIHPTIARFSDKATLFITFEAPARLKMDFEKRRINFIDIVLHPIRFMRDLGFGIHSNFFTPQGRWIVSRDQVRYEASLVRAGCEHVPGIACKPNSLLILGQTPFDRSVIQSGKFLKLIDFEQEIRKLSSQHGQTAYRPHPYSKNHTDSVFSADYGMLGAEPVYAPDTNTYRLLCEPNISTVCSISSSVLAEAQFFDKKVICLGNPWWSGYHHISFPTFTNPMFWREALQMLTQTKMPPPIMIQSEPSLLRKLIKSSWSFDF